MPMPETCVSQARKALKDGGFFASLVPTANQVSALLHALDQEAFGLIEVEEVITRGYKTNPDRFRPKDRMIAHTGYLIFARAMVKAQNNLRVSLKRRSVESVDAETAVDVEDTASEAE